MLARFLAGGKTKASSIPMSALSDRNLLFGILALQMDFISREQLIVGMQSWALAKDLPLADHLERAGALASANRRLLEPLVEAHVHQHNDDPQQSLASLSSASSIKHDLEQIHDSELHASIAHISRNNDPFETLSLPVGQSSSQGTRFRILRPYKEGGLGQVYIARDEEVGREVALKEIKATWAFDRLSRERFRREAEITGGLEHPGIVPVYGLGAYPDGRPFYAMKFIRGKSLKEVIDRFHRLRTVQGKRQGRSESNLELRRLLQRLIDVCEALHYAHSRGVLHRDLKPGNIMVGRYGETFVVDWGLAKALGKQVTADGAADPDEPDLSIAIPDSPLVTRESSSNEQTVQGKAIGTLQFMSPEQAAGRLDLLSPATDVFSLGATLFHLLTGRPPYEGDDIVRQAQQGEVPRPRSVNPDIPPALEAICVRAMERNPQHRYPSAKSLARDIERYLADEPVEALPDTVAAQVARWSRRNRTLVRSAVGAIAAVAVISTGAALQINSARNQALVLAGVNSRLAIDAKSGESKARKAQGEAQQREQEAKAAREEVGRQLRLVTSQRLALQAREALTPRPQCGLLLAAEAVERCLDLETLVEPMARQALFDACTSVSGAPVKADAIAEARHLASINGHLLFLKDNDIHIFATATESLATFRLEGTAGEWATTIYGFSWEGNRVASCRRGFLTLWDTSAASSPLIASQVAELTDAMDIWLTPKGDSLISLVERQSLLGRRRQELLMWDIRGRVPALTHRVAVPIQSLVNLAFTSDGRYMIAAGSGWAIWDLWVADASVNLLRAQQAPTPETPARGRSRPPQWLVAVSPDDGTLAVCDHAGEMELFDLTADYGFDMPIQRYRFGAQPQSVVVGGKFVVAVDSSRELRIIYRSGSAYRLDLGASALEPSSIADSRTLAMSVDEREIAVVRGKNVVMWQDDGMSVVPASVTLRGHEAKLSQIAFNRESSRLYSVDEQQNLRKYACKTDVIANYPRQFATKDKVLGVSVAAQSALVVSRQEIRLCPLSFEGDPSSKILWRAEDDIVCAAFGQTGETLAASTAAGPVHAWRVSEGTLVPFQLELPVASTGAIAIALDNRGRHLAAGLQTGEVVVWLLDPSKRSTILHRFQPQCPTGSIIVGPTAAWIVVDSGKKERMLCQGDRAPIAFRPKLGIRDGVRFSDDGTRLFVESESPQIHLLESLAKGGFPVADKSDMAIERLSAVAPSFRWGVALTFSQSTNPTGSVRLLDLAREDSTIGQQVDIEDALPMCAAFSVDSKLFAVADTLGKIRIWQANEVALGQQPVVLTSMDRNISRLSFSADNLWLVAQGRHSQVWSLDPRLMIRYARQLAGRPLTEEERRLYLEQKPVEREQPPETPGGGGFF